MTNAAGYTPREGSAAWKIIQFLATNPDESLDADLIAAKCDCDRRSVHTLLGPAVQAGLLKRAEDHATGELVYTIGTAVRRTQMAIAAAVEANAPPLAPPAKKRRGTPFWIDTSAVKIDKGVALPTRGTKAIDWTPLLQKLLPGDSFLLPHSAKSAIATAMKEHKDATGQVLTSRRMEDGIRVWRVE